MFRPKAKAKPPARRVWRISASAPQGEWVELADKVAPPPNTELPEVSYGTWVTSSYDLLDGSTVTEDPDTLPGELLDELFAPPKVAPRNPRT